MKVRITDRITDNFPLHLAVNLVVKLIDELADARKVKIREIRDFIDEMENKELTESRQKNIVSMKNLEEMLIIEMEEERQSYLLKLEDIIEYELDSKKD